MIAEPYICIHGHVDGRIEWFDPVLASQNEPAFIDGEKCIWRKYADFERDKLRELGSHIFSCRFDEAPISSGFRIVLAPDLRAYNSKDVCGYTAAEYSTDSESSRLLKRAEFLKAVCGKERVAWLPEEKTDTGAEQLVEILRHRGRHLAECGQDECVTPHCHCWCHKPETPKRDYYTKEEMDDKFNKLKTILSSF